MAGETITDLIPLDSIDTVPVAMFHGLLDNCCKTDQALITKNAIGERVTKFTLVPWATHCFWGGPLSNPLFNQLTEHLRNPERKSYEQELY